MCIKIDKETDTIFDDFYNQDDVSMHFDTEYWTQVCADCATKHKLLDSYLEIGAGNGICGVKGCNNQSDHYYDFNAK